MHQRIASIESQVTQVQVHLGLADTRIQEATTEFRNQIEQKFALEAHEIREIVNQAQEEFTRIRAEVNQTQAGTQTLFEGTKEELQVVKQQVGATENAIQALLRDTQREISDLRQQMASGGAPAGGATGSGGRSERRKRQEQG